MPREDFIQQVKDTLKAQQSEKELGQRSVLHKAEIIKTEGPKKWAELKIEIQTVVKRACGESGGPLVYEFRDTEIEIQNDGRTLKVVYEPNQGAFKYSGIGTGTFSPSVVDSSLVFNTETKTDGTPGIRIGTTTVSQIAEKLIKKVIGLENS